MDTIQAALNILVKDKLNNISIINFIKNNLILSIDTAGNSVLVRGISDRKWIYISCPDKDELNVIKNKLNNDDNNFASIDEWMIPNIVKGKEIKWDLPAVRFYLPVDINLPSSQYKTSPLTEKDAGVVYKNSNYKNYISMEYVKDRIKRGISAGMFENNQLVSWSITQDDGAIGFLHTLDNYRRKGYGYNVTLSMIEKLRSCGELPFAYVERNNKRSMSLLLKLGFKENKSLHWFQIS